MTDIERLKEIAQEKNAQWLGLSNIKAIKNVVAELEKYKRVIEETLNTEISSAYDLIDTAMAITKNLHEFITLIDRDMLYTKMRFEELLEIDDKGDD